MWDCGRSESASIMNTVERQQKQHYFCIPKSLKWGECTEGEEKRGKESMGSPPVGVGKWSEQGQNPYFYTC